MEDSERQLRGLYDRVNISVSTLNKIIIGLCVLWLLPFQTGGIRLVSIP